MTSSRRLREPQEYELTPVDKALQLAYEMRTWFSILVQTIEAGHLAFVEPRGHANETRGPELRNTLDWLSEALNEAAQGNEWVVSYRRSAVAETHADRAEAYRQAKAREEEAS